MSGPSIRILVVVAAVLQLSWFLLPQVEYVWMSEDAIVLTSYTGMESTIEFSAWVSWANLLLTMLVLLGVYVFGSRFRFVALIYFLASIVLYVPLAGMNIETGLSMTLRDLLSLVIGALLATLYLAPSKDNIVDEN